jgi:hypothetical protein
MVRHQFVNTKPKATTKRKKGKTDALSQYHALETLEGSGSESARIDDRFPRGDEFP